MPSSPHVLLVDDHAEVRAVLRSIVVQLCPQATIVEASNGAEALNVAAQQRLALIITDSQMPIMNGLDLVRTLQSQTLPILLVSSDSDMGKVALAEGASAFLPKPFPLAELRDVLRTLLSECEAMQAVGE